jgi:uncharacterized protein
MSIIGIISDTHGLVRPEAVAALSDCDQIIHAGDIGTYLVIEKLSLIAPVSAIKGNIDNGEWAAAFPNDTVVSVKNKFIYVLHNLYDLDLDPVAAGFDVVVSGHSHKPSMKESGGVLYLNPGSAGPRRFKLPITVAMLKISEEKVNAEIVDIVV